MKSPLLRNASILLGAFLLSISSCRKSETGTTWSESTAAAEAQAAASLPTATATETTAGTPAPAPAAEAPAPAPAAPAVEPAPEPAVEPAPEPDPSAKPRVRFIAYNVENWLTMDRYENNRPVGETSKPAKEKQAVIEILVRHRPDVLGLCEIGTEDDLAEIQSLLKAAGLDLPHAYHTGGADEVRHLGLLSRFPVSKTTPHPDLTYRLDGRELGMGRGILDAVVDTPTGPVHFLGTHLKSKREIPEADQEMMRRAEAHLMRKAADAILNANPDTPLVVYGDFNDTRQASAIRTLQGPHQGPTALRMAWLKDRNGHTWTHHWSYQDVYSRFDYVLLSTPMLDRMVWDECKVIDDPDVADASDHRPLLVIFE